MSEERLSGFFSSPTGIGATVIVCCLILIMIAGVLYRKKQFSVRVSTISAMCIALSAVLSIIEPIRLPQGGSTTAFSMLFIVLIGYWFGPEAGILAGVADGLLNLAINPYVIHPIQLLLDYPFAFGALGISGLFRNFLRNNRIGKSNVKFDGLCIGYIVAALARWFMHFMSGFVFFSTFAGDSNPVIYSAVYNFSYILPEMILTLIVLTIPAFRNAIDAVGGDRQAA